MSRRASGTQNWKFRFPEVKAEEFFNWRSRKSREVCLFAENTARSEASKVTLGKREFYSGQTRFSVSRSTRYYELFRGQVEREVCVDAFLPVLGEILQLQNFPTKSDAPLVLFPQGTFCLTNMLCASKSQKIVLGSKMSPNSLCKMPSGKQQHM